MAAKKKSKPEPKTFSVTDAIDDANSVIDELAEEMRNWADSMPENMHGGDKHGQIEESADALESIDKPDGSDLDDETQKIMVSHVMSSGRRVSRSDRCSDAVALYDLVTSELRERQTELEEAAEELEAEVGKRAAENKDSGLDVSVVAVDDLTDTQKQVMDKFGGCDGDGAKVLEWSETLRGYAEECGNVADACENAKDEAENIEFPGMMG